MWKVLREVVPNEINIKFMPPSRLGIKAKVPHMNLKSSSYRNQSLYDSSLIVMIPRPWNILPSQESRQTFFVFLFVALRCYSFYWKSSNLKHYFQKFIIKYTSTSYIQSFILSQYCWTNDDFKSGLPTHQIVYQDPVKWYET